MYTEMLKNSFKFNSLYSDMQLSPTFRGCSKSPQNPVEIAFLLSLRFTEGCNDWNEFTEIRRLAKAAQSGNHPVNRAATSEKSKLYF